MYDLWKGSSLRNSGVQFQGTPLPEVPFKGVKTTFGTFAQNLAGRSIGHPGTFCILFSEYYEYYSVHMFFAHCRGMHIRTLWLIYSGTGPSLWVSHWISIITVRGKQFKYFTWTLFYLVLYDSDVIILFSVTFRLLFNY